jgi:hypothetical protein
MAGLLQGFKLAPQIAAFEYPRRCRIRRVRVASNPDSQPTDKSGPVIVSRRLLGEMRQS